MPKDALTEQDNEVNPSTEKGEVTTNSFVQKDQVQAALAADKGSAARLTTWKVVDFTKKGDNYACIVTSVEVAYELEGQSLEVSYIVKLNPCRQSESSRECDRALFHNEARFYLDIVTEMNSILSDIGLDELKVPKCFYSSLEKDKEIIFLEDLRSQGFKMADRRLGLDETHVDLVLKELAKFHAASFLMQAKAPGEDFSIKYPFLKRNWAYLIRGNILGTAFFKGQVKYCKDLLIKVGGYDRAVKWIDGIFPSLLDVIDDQLRIGKFKVVCHGDMWSNNTVFRYGKDGRPVEVMLLDHQTSSHSSLAMDLNYLMYTSLTGEVREPNLNAFLSTYYDTLIKILKQGSLEPPFTQTQLLQEYRDLNVAGTIFGMVLLPLVIVESEDAVDFNASTEDSIDTMLEEAKVRSLDAQVKNPLTRQRFLSVFDEMTEAGVFP